MPAKPLVVFSLLLALATPVYAQIDTQGLTGQPLIDHVTQDIFAQGYQEIRVKRRPFGEVRILGIKGDVAREVAFFPKSGRVKRDETFDWPLTVPTWDPNKGPDFADIEGQRTH